MRHIFNISRFLNVSALLAAMCVAQAQTLSVLYNLGGTSGDPELPYNYGAFAQGRDGNLYSTSQSGGTNKLGTAFKITPAGALTVVYNFDGTHGSNPYSGLTLAGDGNLYGTTYAGGSNNHGTVFKITPSGALTVLYNFQNSTDGAAPTTPPIQGSDGNFYGTTLFGGAYGDGVIYKMTPAGKMTVLHPFDGTHGTYSQSPLIQARDGNFYGTTYEGGSGNGAPGVAFKITSSGAYTVLHNFDGTNGSDPWAPLVQATDGNLYGTTRTGGSANVGVIYRLTTSGTFTPLYNFGSTTGDGATPYAGLVQATDGSLYGVTQSGGTQGSGELFKITLAGAYSVLQNFSYTQGNQLYVPLLQHTGGAFFADAFAGGTAALGTIYKYGNNAPAYIRVIPARGKVGASVGVLGQGFTGTTSVTIGSIPASFTVNSDTYLTLTLPPGALTAGNSISVKTPGATLANYNQQFNVLPTATSFSPSSGATGTLVTITGTGLTQTTKVTFGGVKATALTVNSDSQLTATVPAGAATGPIAVTTAGGVSTAPGTFTVTP